MAKAQIPGSVKRFGPRYGKTIKSKVAFIEKDQRGLHKCPKCHAIKVKRLALGIWECRKCANKFAGRAYNPGKKIKLIEAVREEEFAEKPTRIVQESKEVEESKVKESNEEAVVSKTEVFDHDQNLKDSDISE